MELMEHKKLHRKLKKTDDVGDDEETRKKLKILLDEIKKKENKGQNSQSDKSEKITKNPGSQNTEKNLSEENKRSNMKSFSSHQPQKIAIIKNQAEMKNKNPTLLIVGIMLIIGSVLAIGYWLGKKNLKNSAK